MKAGRSRWVGFLLAGALAGPMGASPGGDPELFNEQAAAMGLEFVYFNGMSGALFFVENLGGGVALFDYDSDGDLNVYLTQGHMLGAGKTLADAYFATICGSGATGRLCCGLRM